MRRSSTIRRLIALVLLLAALAAIMVYFFQKRQGRIEQAEEHIRAELADLDPLAKAQVLKNVLETEINEITPAGIGKKSKSDGKA